MQNRFNALYLFSMDGTVILFKEIEIDLIENDQEQNDQVQIEERPPSRQSSHCPSSGGPVHAGSRGHR